MRALLVAFALVLGLASASAREACTEPDYNKLRSEGGMVPAYPLAIEAGREALRQNQASAAPPGCKVKSYNGLYKYKACQKALGSGDYRFQLAYRIKFKCSGSRETSRTFFTQVLYKDGKYTSEKWTRL